MTHTDLMDAGIDDTTPAIETDAPAPCSDDWYAWAESLVSTGDGAGHGPDPGSTEWRYAIVFRMGLEGQDGVPAPEDSRWCTFVDSTLSMIEQE
ncbi:MAG: hypothetical protein HKN43_17320 [Rhodothermales bacterium]|nr:hypothetical protein [Rhodothermales bacterium]